MAVQPPPRALVAAQAAQPQRDRVEQAVGQQRGVELDPLAHAHVEGREPRRHRQRQVGPRRLGADRQAHVLGREPAERRFGVGLAILLEVGVHAQRRVAADGERQLDLDRVVHRLGELPAGLEPRHRDPTRLHRRVDARADHHGHDEQRQQYGGRGRVVELEPRQDAPGVDDQGHALPEQVARHRADDGVHHALGEEERADVLRRQADRRQDADLAGALVDRAEHGVEHDERGEQRGHPQRAGARDGARPPRAEQVGAPAAAREQRQLGARHQLAQHLAHLLLVRGPHDDGPQVAAHVDQQLVGHDRHGVGRQVDVLLELFGVGRPLLAPTLGHEHIVHGRDRLAVEVGDLAHLLHAEHADDTERLAEALDGSAQDALRRGAQRLDHRHGQERLGRGIVQPAARYQRFLRAGDALLRRRQAEQRRGVDGRVLGAAGERDERLLADHGRVVPRARHHVLGAAELVAHHVEPDGADRPPLAAPQQQPVVAGRHARVGHHGALEVLDDRREREHREGEQHDGGGGEGGADGAPAQVADAEQERRDCRTEAAHVGRVDPARRRSPLRHQLLEPPHHQREHQHRQREDDERQQDHQRRDRHAERGMEDAQEREHRHERARGAQDAPMNGLRTDQQPLGEERERQHEDEIEDQPLHHVVGRADDLGVDARLERPRGTGVGQEGGVVAPFERRLRAVEAPRGDRVQAAHARVLEPVLAEADDPLFVEQPHVACGPQWRERDRAAVLADREACPQWLLLTGVQQQEPLADRPGAHEDAQPAARLGEHDGTGLGGRHPGRVAGQEVAEVGRRRVGAGVEHGDGVEGHVVALVGEVVEDECAAGEAHDGVVLHRCVHLGLDGVVAGALGAEVGRVGDGARRGVETEGADGERGAPVADGASLGQALERGTAVLIGEQDGLAAHAAERFLRHALLHDHQGAGQRLVGQVVLAEVELHGAGLEPRPVVGRQLADERAGRVEEVGDDAAQQAHLCGQVVEVHAVGCVERSVDGQPRVVGGGKCEAHVAGDGGQLALEGEGGGQIGAPVAALCRVDAIDEARIGPPSQRVARLPCPVRPALAQVGEPRLEPALALVNEVALVEQPHPPAVARQVEPHERRHVQRRLPGALGRQHVAPHELPRAGQRLAVARRRHEHHAPLQREPLERARQLQQRDRRARLLRTRRAGGHDRHRVVVGGEDDAFLGVAAWRLGQRGHHVRGLGVHPVHPRGESGPRRLLRRAEPLDERHPLAAADPVARRVGGHGEELRLGLGAKRLVGLDEDHGLGAKQEGVEPIGLATEVEEHNRPLDLLAIEVLRTGAARVDQRAGDAVGRQGGRAHQVRPQAAQRDRLVAPGHAERRAAVHRHGHTERLEVHVRQPDLAERGGNVLCRLGRSWIARYARAVRGQLLDALPQPARVHGLGHRVVVLHLAYLLTRIDQRGIAHPRCTAHRQGDDGQRDDDPGNRLH